MKGYKVFNQDWKCRGFQYEVGKEYEHKGNIKLCGSGFHFCRKAQDCFNYYDFNSSNKVAEVEALGLIESGDDKSVTNKIKIVRELTWHEVLDLVNNGKDNTGLANTGDWNTGNRNTGDWNTGNRNTGDWNTGDWNTGNRNTGNWNTGDWNTGNWNTGNRNTGDWNTGDWNTGNWNTGDWNTGNRNTGDWNTGNRNTGDWNTGDCNTGNWNTGDWNIVDHSGNVFSSDEQKIKIFDKETNLSYIDWHNSKAAQILRWNLELTVWIYEKNMSDEEKENHPEYKIMGGYLRKFEFEEACRNMWDNLTDDEKKEVKNIPNFDKDKFLKITGIRV